VQLLALIEQARENKLATVCSEISSTLQEIQGFLKKAYLNKRHDCEHLISDFEVTPQPFSALVKARFENTLLKILSEIKVGDILHITLGASERKDQQLPFEKKGPYIYFKDSDKEQNPRRRYFGLHIDPNYPAYLSSKVWDQVQAYYFASAYQRYGKDHLTPNAITLNLTVLDAIHKKGAKIIIGEHIQCGFDTLTFYPLQEFILNHKNCFYYKGCCDSPLINVSAKGKRTALTQPKEAFLISKEPERAGTNYYFPGYKNAACVAKRKSATASKPAYSPLRSRL